VSFAEGALVACKLVCGLGCFPIHTRRQQLAHAWFQACSCRMPCHTPALTRITIPAGHTSWPPASSTPRTRCLCWGCAHAPHPARSPASQQRGIATRLARAFVCLAMVWVDSPCCMSTLTPLRVPDRLTNCSNTPCCMPTLTSSRVLDKLTNCSNTLGPAASVV